jgi:DNA polymerase-3 subunit beta
VITGTAVAKPQAFTAAVKWAAKFVATRPAVPIHGGLLLDITDGQLSIVGHNESITARAIVPVEGDGAGQAVVSARLLATLAATFPDKLVEIGPDRIDHEHASPDTLGMTVGTWSGTLPTMTEGQFPSPPNVVDEAIGRIPGDAFAAAVRRAGVAASTNEKQLAMLHCMHLTFGDGRMEALATDRYRAARGTAPFEAAPGTEPHATAVVRAEAFIDAAEAFAGPDDVFVAVVPGSVIALASPTRAVVVTQSGEEYTVLEPIRQMLARELPQRIRVHAPTLIGPMKRAQAVRDKDGPIAVTFAPAAVRLSARAEELAQWSTEEIGAIYDGPEHTLMFNPGYFADALTSAPGDVVDISFITGGPAAVVLSAPDDETWRHVLMPIGK